MAKVSAGLRELAARDLLPDGEYSVKVTEIFDTNDGTGEMARLLVLKGPEPELKGKSAVMYILNKQTLQAIGLSQIMKAVQLEEIEDSSDIVDAEFECTISEGVNKKTGQKVNNVTPHYDTEWWNSYLAESSEDAPRRSKKKTSKRAR